MKNVRAFVVGVNHYGVERWNDQGGFANNAAAIALWLSENGVESPQIHLFLDQERLSNENLAALKYKDIHFLPTNFSTINRFWRTDLPGLAQPGEHLFFFWSGHGVTGRGRHRIFFCGDYSPEVSNCVFNMHEFLINLSGARFRSFSKQLLFADTCGTYGGAPTAATYEEPEQIFPTDQLAIMASPEGDFAEMNEESGVFTDALLPILRTFDKIWPERTLLLERFEEAAKALALKTFRYDLRANDLDKPECKFGHLTPGAVYAESAYKMLAPNVTGQIARLHYERTLAGLGPAVPSKILTLREMIDDLSDRQDSRAGSAPYGLVEFLTRLENDPSLDQPVRKEIEDWIESFGREMRTEARERLDNDRRKRFLLIEVRHELGLLSEVIGYVRYADLTPVPGLGEMGVRTDNWDQLADAVRKWIDDPRIKPEPVELELHFLADPPLFDLPFHTIIDSDGSPIGEQHVCVIHSLRRARQDDLASDVQAWRNWETKVNAQELAELPLRRLAQSPPWQMDGLCYMDFAIPNSPHSDMAKKSLKRLIQLGAPYIYWLHSDAQLALAPDALEQMKRSAENLGELPNAIYWRRVNQCETAIEASVLWDPRWFRPFLKTQGATRWQDGGFSAGTEPGTTT